MRVIGTAGHVDHGKSTLVHALTGIDPDRLAEEKARELTIDLGFAWFSLPAGEKIGVIDVPGHRDFIENMLAGIGSIDLVMLVVAADEGIMPQTTEHLAIINLLGIPSGIVVLTRTDLIEESDWLEMVELDVRDALRSTQLADAPIVRVSAKNGRGLAELSAEIERQLAGLPPKEDLHNPRLPIDRVFSLDGFGTIVTGTLTGGSIMVGDIVAIQPGNHRARVRNLQNYRQPVQIASPGSRVAVNLSGINKHELQRGAVLCLPDRIQPTTLIDAQFKHLATSEREIRHNTQIKFFSGTSECLARLRLLDREALAPGETAWVQISLATPQALSDRDRFIIRIPSPAETVGGGTIVNVHPAKRWKRFREEVTADLQARLEGTIEDRVLRHASAVDGVTATQISQLSGLELATVSEAIQTALAQGTLTEIETGRFMSAQLFGFLSQQIMAFVAAFHATFPLRSGIPREQLRQQMHIKQAVYNALLRECSLEVVTRNNLIRAQGFQIAFSAAQETQRQMILDQLRSRPLNPPDISEWKQPPDAELLHALVATDEIVMITNDICYLRSAYDHIRQIILAEIDTNGSVDAKTLRDRLGASRKYAIAILEHLDEIGFTRRSGDVRVRGKNT
jgi:selenocysteine-specific elongation factor